MPAPRRLAAALLLAAAAARPGAARAQPVEAFAVQSVGVPGRVVAAEIADFDGDGRAELLAVAFDGVWPEQTRAIQVHRAAPDGTVAAEPAWRESLPPDAAAYDVADVDGRPGAELLLLGRDGVHVLALAGGTPRWRALRVPSGPTAAVAPDERGLDRVRLARRALGVGRLLVPGLGEAFLLGAQGEAQGRLAIGGRGNYFAPPRPGPLIGENELEMFLDVPTLHVADVDGDARPDVVATNRHELRVFRQRADGSFPADPDATLRFRLVTSEDQALSAGSVRTDVRDVDGDGRADLLVSHSTGGLLRATNHTRFHRNRGGTWKLDEPDQAFPLEGGLAADQLLDVDGDGRLEWLRVSARFGLLQLAELFLRRSLELRAEVRRADGANGFAAEPWLARTFAIPVDFETFRPRGFLPNVARDWNGDGARDLLVSEDGTRVEVWLGGAEHRFAAAQGRQALDAAGRVRFGDLDGDGLADWVLYDPRKSGAPVRLGVNRGVLPGTPAGIRAR